MKKNIITLTIILATALSPAILMAQSDGPGNPGGEPGGETPIGGGAPVGSGLAILMGMGAAYGGRKLYKLNKEKKEKMTE